MNVSRLRVSANFPRLLGTSPPSLGFLSYSCKLSLANVCLFGNGPQMWTFGKLRVSELLQQECRDWPDLTGKVPNPSAGRAVEVVQAGTALIHPLGPQYLSPALSPGIALRFSVPFLYGFFFSLIFLLVFALSQTVRVLSVGPSGLGIPQLGREFC